MNEHLFIQLNEFALSLAVITGTIFILAATWHDLRTIRLRKFRRSMPSDKSDQSWPPIIVLVYAHNAETTIQSCLRSIQANRYAHCVVIVANNASTDSTRKQVAAYKRLHPETPVRIYSTKSMVDRTTLLRRTLRNDHSGQIIINLDAKCIISSSTLRECASRFMSDRHLDIVRLRHLPSYEVSIRSLTYYFYTLSMNIILKSFAKYSYLYLDGSITNGFAFKRLPLDKSYKITSKSVDYASGINYSPINISGYSIMNSPTSLPVVIRLLSFIGTLLVIYIMSYFFYTAALLQSNLLLTLSWTAISLWLLATIWLDDALPGRKKLDLTTTVPFMYFYLYVYLFTVAITLVRKIISAIPTPNLPYDKMHLALLTELYSTRY